MATLYITEYSESRILIGGQMVQVPLEPPLAEQTVTISGTHAESAAFNAKTTFVRIETDLICSLLIGTAPVATTSSGRWVAGQTEFRGIRDGQGYMVSVIANT